MGKSSFNPAFWVVPNALFHGLFCTKLRTLSMGLCTRQRALAELHLMGKLEMLPSVILTIVPSFDGYGLSTHGANPIKPLIVVWRLGILEFPFIFRRKTVLDHTLQSDVVLQVLFGQRTGRMFFGHACWSSNTSGSAHTGSRLASTLRNGTPGPQLGRACNVTVAGLRVGMIA